MAIHTVVTMGYSVAGGFQGGTATLPTMGFDSGLVIVPTSEGLEAASPGRPLHARAGGERLHAKSPGKPLHVRTEGE